MVYIYYAYISQERHTLLFDRYAKGFPQAFIERLYRFRRWQDAQLSLIGWVLIQKGMQKLQKTFRYEDLQFTKYNKPYLANDTVQFNISHSGNIVVCAISPTHTIGIDVEVIHDIDPADFKSQMTLSEWKSIIGAKDQQRCFFEYWTQKESVIKAHGMGLSIPLQSFEVNDYGTRIGHMIFQVKKVELDKDYICHISFPGEICPDIASPAEIIP
ncbi:4'-phosphopantetheinyl transferase family protein [Ascidiimonas aurantiaca]|uniref:4'-phosphopantetheinyl transferase family protein n=1 Tax=Ascidiimonas aurantiaca TaxID=1685432 RepID=UPI0030EB4355